MLSIEKYLEIINRAGIASQQAELHEQFPEVQAYYMSIYHEEMSKIQLIKKLVG